MGASLFAGRGDRKATHSLALGGSGDAHSPQGASQLWLFVLGIEVGADKPDHLVISDDDATPGVGEVEGGVVVLLRHRCFDGFLSWSKLH